jgi:hypothetical protein
VLTPTGAIRASWAVLMVLLSSVLVAAACIVYTGHVARQTEQRQDRARMEADQRWCPLLDALDQPRVPPETERGRQIQREIHRLRTQTGCETR